MDVTIIAAGAFAGLGTSISLFATVFGLIAIAGGAAGYFKASTGESTIKYQDIELNLRDRKIAGLEKDLATVNEILQTKEQVIVKQENHIKYLQKLGQGSPELKKLRTAIENQTKVISEALKGRQ